MEKLKLIDGEFSPTEFKEIVYNLFLKKIEFHKIKNFSSQIRFGIDDTVAIQKINEINQSIEKLSKLFEEVQEKDTRVFVFSEIQVRLKETQSV